MSYLDAHVVVRRPTHTLDVHLVAEPGEVIAVIGPNGAGKTTLLRALAGAIRVDDGAINVDGQCWDDPGSTPMTAPERRAGVTFQRQLLFPHLDAIANVAFGPRSRGVPRREAERTAHEWLGRFGIEDLAHRKPAELSGGQAQRVAIARALATEPRLLLLDEPLASLDVGVAMALRLDLVAHLAAYDGVAIVVTHDALDARTLADRIVVIDEGRVAQDGRPDDVAQRPATAHVARLVGLNVLRGTGDGTDIRLADGSVLVTATPSRGVVNACFTPAAVTLTSIEPTGSARNRWHGRVNTVTPHGAAVRVHLDAAEGLIADVTPESAARLRLSPGREVWATVKATEIDVYEAVQQ